MPDTSAIPDRISKKKWKLLLHTKKILDSHNIPFWIDSGTLLGFIRDRQFLPHSRTIHIGILGEHLDKVLSLKNDFRPWHKLILTYERSGRQWIDGNVNSLYLKPILKKARHAFRLYITPHFITGPKARWIDGVDGWVCKSVSSRFFNNLASHNQWNVMLPIPNDVESYLQERYGTWKVPAPLWDSNRDDGAIISTKTMRQLKKKSRWTRPPRHTEKMMMQGKNLLRAKRLLADTGKILTRHGIHWWLDHGTLLGIIRNNELIPYDHDVDVCASGEDADKFLAIINQFKPKYRVRLRYDTTGKLPGKLRVAKIKYLMGRVAKSRSAEELHLDIFFNYPQNDGYSYWIDSCTLKRTPLQYYNTLSAVEWNNSSYPVPGDTEGYLAYRFGDWRTPVQKYDSTLDDQAIVD